MNRRYAFQFVSHWFYNIISFGGRALPAPVAELFTLCVKEWHYGLIWLSLTMARRLLLIMGIPGTGKTTIGDYLQLDHGFLHVNREIHQPPEFSNDPSGFLAQNKKDIVATWGFRPKEQEDIDGVEQLLNLGFKGVWLDGHRPWALNHFMRSKPHMEWSFYLQMYNMETGSVP